MPSRGPGHAGPAASKLLEAGGSAPHHGPTLQKKQRRPFALPTHQSLRSIIWRMLAPNSGEPRRGSYSSSWRTICAELSATRPPFFDRCVTHGRPAFVGAKTRAVEHHDELSVAHQTRVRRANRARPPKKRGPYRASRRSFVRRGEAWRLLRTLRARQARPRSRAGDRNRLRQERGRPRRRRQRSCASGGAGSCKRTWLIKTFK